VAFDENVAIKMAEVPRQEVPDLSDRIIAATALYYDVPAPSRDNRIASRREVARPTRRLGGRVLIPVADLRKYARGDHPECIVA
jgi:hypothetical protein